ncbi:amidase [Alcaligenaceae bacterium B3P038]|nr:amidase [Alcaligenaceae bacterium B3P038]
MHSAIASTTDTLHGITSRTGGTHIASEVLRLNAAVCAAADGQLDGRAQPGDFGAMLMSAADGIALETSTLSKRDVHVTSVPASPSGGQSSVSQPATLADAARLMASGAVTSESLTLAAIARAQAVQPHHRPFIALHAEAAVAQAQERDRERRSGMARSALHGIPLAHKDCFERNGAPMTVGSKVPVLPVQGVTATVLTRLSVAGAVDLGPLNMNEMVCGPTGQNPHFGDCTNAWDSNRISGGSSSGSAVAVALGAAFGSLGSDTGGSIRLPASMNGVFGLKPTYGLVSRHGCFPRAFSLDCVGPIARTAEDCALLLTAIAGHDAADPTNLPAPVHDYAGALLQTADRNSRIGILTETGALDDGVAATFDGFVTTAALHYGALRHAPFESRDACYAMGDIISKVEAATLHGAWMRRYPERYSQAVYSRTEPGLHVPAVRYLEALSMRARLLDDFLRGPMAQCDVLLLPTVPIPVPTREAADMEHGDRVFDVVAALTRFTRAFNYLGLPVLSMPIGLDGNGMPIGVQLVARPFGEARLLAMAHALSGDIDWQRTSLNNLRNRHD